MEVEFDEWKAKSNLRKHGVSFNEASTVFDDEHTVWMEDPDANGELRWILRGISNRGRLLAVVFTVRGNSLRLISARRASKTEIKDYARRV